MKFLPVLFASLALLATTAGAQEKLTMEALKGADYNQGRSAFQGRCSACHTLADDSADIAGPNLFGVFDRVVGSKEGFDFSATLKDADFVWTPDLLEAWLADPQGYLPGNIMGIPEAVPERDRLALLSFMMIETGKVDWPRPEPDLAAMAAEAELPYSERFPSFWNHLMFNTTRYRWEDAESGEDVVIFEAYFKEDGTVLTDNKRISGFWHIDQRNFFCYALKGLPTNVGHMVECFPVAAMAIPRFAEELWTSKPQPGVNLHGGMVPGRPDWVAESEF